MTKQMELFQKSNVDKLADYFKNHVYQFVNFNQLAADLEISKQEVIKAWNALNRDHRILKINVGSRDYVIQTLHGELPNELNPMHFNKTKYQIIAKDTGMTVSNIQAHLASWYGVSEWDYNPSIYRRRSLL